jgi:hypothetical protein
MTSASAKDRYNRTILLLSVAYGVLLFGAVWLFRHAAPTGALAIVAALAPALPVVSMFGAIGRYLATETDEYQRAMTVRQTLIASGFALTVATVWGFLESFGVAPHVGPEFVVLVWCVGMGIGKLLARIEEHRA